VLDRYWSGEGDHQRASPAVRQGVRAVPTIDAAPEDAQPPRAKRTTARQTSDMAIQLRQADNLKHNSALQSMLETALTAAADTAGAALGGGVPVAALDATAVIRLGDTGDSGALLNLLPWPIIVGDTDELLSDVPTELASGLAEPCPCASVVAIRSLGRYTGPTTV